MALDDTTKKIVQEMLDSGAESISVIHRFLQSHYNYTNCYSVFYTYFKEGGFETPAKFRRMGRLSNKDQPKKRTLSPELQQRVQEMVDSGKYSSVSKIYDELTQEGNYSFHYKSFLRACKEEITTPPHFIKPGGNARKYTYRDELIFHEPPLTLVEIAQKESEKTGKSVTRHAIQRYMERRGYHAEWEERKNTYRGRQKCKNKKKYYKKIERQNPQQELLEIIRAYYVQRALQEDKPKGYAAWYFYSIQRRKSNHQLEDLERFFTAYFEAKGYDEQKTLAELGAYGNFPKKSASRILHAVDLEPLCENPVRKEYNDNR